MLRVKETFILSIFLMLPLLPVLALSATTYGATINTSYSVSLWAYDAQIGKSVKVSFIMDGSTNYFTNHTFTDLTGVHTFTMPVNDSLGTPFNNWSNESGLVTLNRTLTVTSGGTFVAVYAFGIPPPPPPPTYYTLIISTTTGGSTFPSPGTYSIIEGYVVSVQELPDFEYLFDHWELDGSNIGSMSLVFVAMNTNHGLYAVFVYSPASGVGGNVVPVDKFALFTLLLAPYVPLIGFASTAIIAAAVATALYVKRRKKQQ